MTKLILRNTDISHATGIRSHAGVELVHLGVRAICRAVHESPALVELDLSNNYLGPHGVAQLLGALRLQGKQQLKRLNISNVGLHGVFEGPAEQVVAGQPPTAVLEQLASRVPDLEDCCGFDALSEFFSPGLVQFAFVRCSRFVSITGKHQCCLTDLCIWENDWARENHPVLTQCGTGDFWKALLWIVAAHPTMTTVEFANRAAVKTGFTVAGVQVGFQISVTDIRSGNVETKKLSEFLIRFLKIAQQEIAEKTGEQMKFQIADEIDRKRAADKAAEAAAAAGAAEAAAAAAAAEAAEAAEAAVAVEKAVHEVAEQAVQEALVAASQPFQSGQVSASAGEVGWHHGIESTQGKIDMDTTANPLHTAAAAAGVKETPQEKQEKREQQEAHAKQQERFRSISSAALRARARPAAARAAAAAAAPEATAAHGARATGTC